ncbi:tripartite tricarboxylate transporter TctB family protein [Devosia algicola]|uniref:Tripartite tricarboxylate transporter TctB family protein n=1 Tax=Devosia algicola TaxID=3026418 RepID=A0ABY7YR72_9HYPH|nr:tripartite tricarboxylate transporter TctB family protein [Devosia algicola]WDR03550.1 tripartite tricarboxylate transporter TctB family protein [Devosia algicola]
MRKSIVDIAAGLLFLILSIGLYFRALQIHNPGFDPLGPAFMPEFALILIAGCSLLLMAQGLLALRHPAPPGALEAGQPTRLKTRILDMLRPFGAILLLALYISMISIKLASFEVLTLVYFIATGLLIGARGNISISILFVASILTSFSVGYVFKNLLYVNLP